MWSHAAAILAAPRLCQKQNQKKNRWLIGVSYRYCLTPNRQEAKNFPLHRLHVAFWGFGLSRLCVAKLLGQSQESLLDVLACFGTGVVKGDGGWQHVVERVVGELGVV